MAAAASGRWACTLRACLPSALLCFLFRLRRGGGACLLEPPDHLCTLGRLLSPCVGLGCMGAF